MLIHSIHLNHFLSFGDASEGVKFGPLNLVIGPNGAGKSNLLEAIALLQSAPDQLLKPIREGGGVRDWLYKGGSSTPVAALDVVLDNPKGPQPLRYCLEFTEVGQRFQITDERIENDLLVELGVVTQLLADREKLDQRPDPGDVDLRRGGMTAELSLGCSKILAKQCFQHFSPSSVPDSPETLPENASPAYPQRIICDRS